MYLQRAQHSKGKYCDEKEDKSTESIFATFLFVSQFLSDSWVDESFFYIKSYKIREIECFSIRNIGLFRTQFNIYNKVLLQK